MVVFPSIVEEIRVLPVIPPPVLEERAIIVRDLGLLLPRNSGSAKFRAAPALLAGTKEIEVCRRRTKAFDWSCPECVWCVPEECPRAWLLAKQHAWAHRKVLQTEKTLVRDDLRKQRCEAAVKNSRELLVALWNERRPECAHQLTGETKGWKIASARAPTRLHRCAVCDKWLHTGPSRLLPCWKAACYSSQNDPLYIANYGSLVMDLRSTWIATKMEHYQERRASRARRENLASCLPQERFERC